MHFLTAPDYCILVIVVLSILISFFRGLVKEIFSLIVWILAIWLSIHFYQPLSQSLESLIHSHAMRNTVSFLLIFVFVFVLGAILNFLISRFIHTVKLTGPDRFLGIIFGLVRGLLVCTVAIMAIQSTSFTKEIWWKNSQFVPYFKPLEATLKKALPKNLKTTLKKHESFTENV